MKELILSFFAFFSIPWGGGDTVSSDLPFKLQAVGSFSPVKQIHAEDLQTSLLSPEEILPETENETKREEDQLVRREDFLTEFNTRSEFTRLHGDWSKEFETQLDMLRLTGMHTDLYTQKLSGNLIHTQNINRELDALLEYTQRICKYQRSNIPCEF